MRLRPGDRPRPRCTIVDDLNLPQLRSNVARHLREFDRLRSTETLSPAAVALVMMENGGDPCVPIFQRPVAMKRHAGQMALPGGRVHAGETLEECAIRELHEELGLDVEHSDVLGNLDDFETRSGFTITPVVIWSAAVVEILRPSQLEVDMLFAIPLTELREAVATAHPGESSEFSLKFRRVDVFAPTAAILYQFSEVALDGRPSRVGNFYQPPFTHR